MMCVRFLFLIQLFHWSTWILHAQFDNVSFQHFDYEHGLSAAVTHIAQDSLGFLWLGTTDGLNRFDGKNFEVYRNIPGDPQSVPNNIINDICTDQQGRVWVATNGGICYYDYADGVFHQVVYDDKLEKIDRHRVHALCPSRNGGLWFGTKTHIHHWREGGVEKYFPLPGGEALTIKYLYEDKKGMVWIGTNDTLYALVPEPYRLFGVKVTSPFTIEKGLDATVHPILPYDGDTLLIGSWYGGVHKVILTEETIQLLHIPDLVETDPRKHVVRGICAGPDGKYWVGSYGNGLSVLEPKENRFLQHYHHDPSDNRSLSTDYVFDVFRDASGILWIGTRKGLDKFDPLTRQFMSVPIPAFSDEFSVYRLPRWIEEDKFDPGWLWVTVSGVGLFHYHPKSGEFVLFHHDPNRPGSLPDNVVYKIYYDHLDRVWIGMASGICLMDPHTHQFERKILPCANQPKGVHEIIQEKNGTFWFATFNDGIVSYNESTSECMEYTYQGAETHSIPDNKVFCMLADHRGHVWIGTQNRGLCRLDPATGEFLFFEHEKGNLNSLPNNGIFDLHEIGNDRLWVATENGLAELDMNDFSITHYNTGHGLSNNVVFSIEPDRTGHYWLATFNGLSRFDPATKTFKNYYVLDGLPTNSISGALYCASDGTLYFGTSGMVTSCMPERMKMNRRAPPVVITGFEVFDEEMKIHRNGNMFEPIHLSHRQNMITFKFTALNFTNAILNQYAYRLEGFNDQWIPCGQTQAATFTNLDGGTYIFRVKAANNDGVWNEQGAEVQLIVHPPYWKTWWFYVLCAMGIAGILFAAYRIRINQLMKLQMIRTRISRDLHDDIGSTLSSINMISSMASRSIPEGKRMTELFNTIASASSQAMDLMSDIVWSINPKNDRMEMIIIRMRQYASEILEAAGMNFILDIDNACTHITLDAARRKDFYLIFKEAVNNAAKYSLAERVHIRVGLMNKRLMLEVTDDGVGFTGDESHQGNGIRNMRARAAQLKGELTICSEQDKGTRIVLQMPVSP